jgi:hypothetical protein
METEKLNRKTVRVTFDADTAANLVMFFDEVMANAEGLDRGMYDTADRLRDEYHRQQYNFHECLKHGNIKGAEINKHNMAVTIGRWNAATLPAENLECGIDAAKMLRAILQKLTLDVKGEDDGNAEAAK